MAFQNKQFIVGQNKVPDWLNEEATKGRVKFNYDDGDLIDIVVFTPTKTFTAHKGDVVMLLRSGLTVLPADKVKQYGVVKANGKNNEKEEE